MQVIIACRVNRKKNQRALDTHCYKARHLVENLFQRMNEGLSPCGHPL
jgi:hypothetical protein